MKAPSPPGTAVNFGRKNVWHDRFLHYRYPPSIEAIDEFMRQFGPSDADTAARLLDSVEVLTRAQLELAFRETIGKLPGWHRDKSKRTGRWRFVPFSFSVGDSGDQMIAVFRQAVGLKRREDDELFVSPRDLPAQRLRADDTIVLVDDFSGSGKQATESWEDLFKELVGGAGTSYLIVAAATTDAQQLIRDRTDLEVLCHFDLGASDNLFSDECTHFSKREKEAILKHCTAHFPKCTERLRRVRPPFRVATRLPE